MLREILDESLDHLLNLVHRLQRAFEIIKNQEVSQEDLNEIRRLVHCLKGNLQGIGLKDDANDAIELEDEIFNKLNSSGEQFYIGYETINHWNKLLNKIEFSLKSYQF